VLLWVWIAVVVIALIVLAVPAVRLLSRLGGLSRAMAKAQRRAAEAEKLQVKLAELEQTVQAVQAHAER